MIANIALLVIGFIVMQNRLSLSLKNIDVLGQAVTPLLTYYS
ncbi:hypothetical protein [uncultured Gilliamella sp.]|nr:hypothetical protein [uncultured Gilliamella sp.]